MVDYDGNIRLRIAGAGSHNFDEVIYSITNNARGVDVTIDVAASAADTNFELPSFGFEGVLVFYDPANTGELSVKLGSASNDSFEINPILAISGSDVDGLVDIYLTNDDTANANELRIIGLIDKST